MTHAWLCGCLSGEMAAAEMCDEWYSVDECRMWDRVWLRGRFSSLWMEQSLRRARLRVWRPGGPNTRGSWAQAIGYCRYVPLSVLTPHTVILICRIPTAVHAPDTHCVHLHGRVSTCNYIVYGEGAAFFMLWHMAVYYKVVLVLSSLTVHTAVDDTVCYWRTGWSTATEGDG